MLTSHHLLHCQPYRALMQSQMYLWEGSTGCIPQGSVLGPELFKMFVGNMDSETECTLSKAVYHTKLCHLLDTLQEREAIQRHLGRLERWA